MDEGTAALSIGQVAERTGLSVHALRFYEREGLFVDPVRRGPGGRRVYTEDDVDWLTVCVILRASGMPLPRLRRYAEFVREGAGNENERLTLMREHQADVTAQIGKLTRCLDLISFKVRVYEDLVDTDGGAGDRQCHAPAPSPHEEHAPVLRHEAAVE